MDVDITIKNYRRFSDQHPARLAIRRGLTAFIGVNNSGKSALLRFFYDFRNLFRALSSFNEGLLPSLRNDAGPGFTFPTAVGDPAEVFSLSTDRNLEIECMFHHEVPTGPTGTLLVHKLWITVLRDHHGTFRTRLLRP